MHEKLRDCKLWPHRATIFNKRNKMMIYWSCERPYSKMQQRLRDPASHAVELFYCRILLLPNSSDK